MSMWLLPCQVILISLSGISKTDNGPMRRTGIRSVLQVSGVLQPKNTKYLFNANDGNYNLNYYLTDNNRKKKGQWLIMLYSIISKRGH